MTDYFEKSKTHLTPEQLAEFVRCPLLMKKRRAGLVAHLCKDNVGLGVHCLVLEGEQAFQDRFTADQPINKSTGKPFGTNTKAYQEWVASHDKTVIKPEELTKILAMAESVTRHQHVSPLLQTGEAYKVFRGRSYDTPAQCKVDWVSEDNQCLQLCTTSNLDEFENHIGKYRYQLQFSLISQLAESWSMFAVAVESREPYRTGVWCIRPDESQLVAAIHQYKEAAAMQKWTTGFERLRYV